MATNPRLSGGELTVDPSENVKALTEAANVRQDDLRKETDRRINLALKHLKVLIKKGERYQAMQRKDEAARLDSIRQVDREDVNKTATQAQNAIAALAQVTTTTAETLRTTVANTASAQATALANSMGEVNKRLSALELGSSEGRGKAAVESPMMNEMIQKVERLTAAIAEGAGKQAHTDPAVAKLADEQIKQNAILLSIVGQKQGTNDARVWIGWAIAALVGLFTLYQAMRGR